MACTGAGLARFHKWNINRPGPVMPVVIRPGVPGPHFTLQSNTNCKFRLVPSSLTPVPRI
ncbi:hypothetical protein LF1_52570 [Rubripirellula obstinata]|uniref:Uncharacterized protein n=1 Tax=Rubripirellula obstinata TaxID=406547 RepID=A0A5B1C8F4_9BACT|nr:hypothetical protein LF1_52570 [Rubripirellula obstinata]